MEKDVRIIEVKRSIFEDNDRDAARLREELREKRVFLLNLMSSPGSGKTATLLALAKALKGRVRMGVMEADIDSAVDVKDAGSRSEMYPDPYRRHVPSGRGYDQAGAV